MAANGPFPLHTLPLHNPDPTNSPPSSPNVADESNSTPLATSSHAHDTDATDVPVTAPVTPPRSSSTVPSGPYGILTTPPRDSHTPTSHRRNRHGNQPLLEIIPMIDSLPRHRQTSSNLLVPFRSEDQSPTRMRRHTQLDKNTRESLSTHINRNSEQDLRDIGERGGGGESVNESRGGRERTVDGRGAMEANSGGGGSGVRCGGGRDRHARSRDARRLEGRHVRWQIPAAQSDEELKRDRETGV